MISLFVCRNSLKLVLGLLICLTSSGWAQSPNTQALQRYSVAVFDFEVTSVIEAYPQNLGEIMADFFGTPLVNSGRFKVINRAELEKIIEELGLGEAGIVNPDQAKRFGEVAGVDIIITGNIAILAPDHYRITARFTDVATSEIAEQQALRASGPEEFLEVASEFVELAKARFPLQGQVLAIQNGETYINLGFANGLTEQESEGLIYRVREVAGNSFSTQIGTFTIQQIDQTISLIRPQLNEGLELHEGDIVSIQPADTLAEPLPPSPETGGVTIATGNILAQVFLDGEAKGQTPLDLLDLDPGEHQLRLVAENHQPIDTTITVIAGQTQAIAEILEPFPAQVTLTISEPSFDVFVNGESQGQTSQLSLAPGNYDVEVTAPNKEAAQLRFELTPGQNVTQTIMLTPQPVGIVTISVEPATAELLIDGRVEQVGTLELSEGVYDIEVRAEGFSAYNERVEIFKGQETSIDIKLEALQTYDVTDILSLTVKLEQGGEIAIAPGEYELIEPLRINSSVKLVGAGSSETIIKSTSEVLIFEGAGELSLSGIAFQHIGTVPSHTVVVTGGNLDITECGFMGSVAIAEGAARSGLIITGNTKGTITHSNFQDNHDGLTVGGEAVIDLESNMFSENRNFGLLYSVQSSGLIKNITVTDNGSHGMAIFEQAQVEVRNSKFIANIFDGIQFAGTAGGIITENIIQANGDDGISLRNRAQPSIYDNDIIGNVAYGIRYRSTTSPQIGSNIIENNLLGDIQINE